MAIVIGGGLSGLSAAYYLTKRFGKNELISLYETSTRLGGWVRTEKHDEKGFIFEIGPRTIRPKGLPGANTLELISELNLPIDPIRSNHPAARNRMIYAKGQLCMLPNNLLGVFKKHPPFSKPLITALFHDLRSESKKMRNDDESMYDFVERRFGSDIAKYAISPMLCGICAGDAKEISVRFLMSDLFDKEQKWGSVTKGIFMSMFKDNKKTTSKGIFQDEMPKLYDIARRDKWSMYRVENGLETFPKILGNYIKEKGVNINLSTDLRSLRFKNGKALVNLKEQETEVNHVICAIPSYKLAPCVQDQHPSLASLLQSIPYVDVAVVNLQYNSKDLLRERAFGFLVPPAEELPILGVIFDSCCFDMKDNTVLTVMMGGKWFNKYFNENIPQWKLLEVAQKYLNLILGIEAEPQLSRVHILKKCIPQYTVGHSQRVSDIRRYITHYKLPMSVCGAAYDGVGINDVILSARLEVEKLKI